MKYQPPCSGISPQMCGSGGGDESLAGDAIMFPSHGARSRAEDHHAAGKETARNTGYGEFHTTIYPITSTGRLFFQCV